MAIMRITLSRGGMPYELVPATADTLGGVKVGDGLTITADGTLSVVGGGTGGEPCPDIPAVLSPYFINLGDDGKMHLYKIITED